MADPLFGKNWILNLRAFEFPSSHLVGDGGETRRYDEVPNGYRLTVNGTRNRQSYSWGYTALYDGQPHPVTGRDDIDSIVAYRVNELITIGFFSKGGDDRGVAYQRILSSGGDHLKIIASGREANGSPYFDVLQYIAQADAA